MRITLGGLAVLAAFLAFPVNAQVVSARVIRFEPPNPTDATPVVIHVSGPNQLSCVLDSAEVAVDGLVVTVTVHASQCGLYPPSPDAWFHAAVRVSPVRAGRYDVAVRVETLGSTTAIGSSTLVVRDAAPSFEVIPNVVTGLGASRHESVELVGDGFNTYGCRICPKLLVHLGDVVVDVSNEFNTFNSIHVPVPEHAPGIVDVSVERDGVIVARSNSALQFVGLGTGDPAFFEQVLLPVILNAPGAFGSRWKTDVALYNGNDYSIVGSVTTMCDPPPCPGPQPRNLFTIVGADAPQGVVLPLPRQAAKRVTFGLLARDLSKQSEALGTELPVVREADLRDGAFSLLNVPTDPRFRVGLRLYGIDDVRGATIRIRPMDNESNDILTQVIALSASAADSGRSATFAYVGDLLTKYPLLAGPLRVEIDANGARVWGFISVTNNETQHVTVISPQ